MQSNEEKETNAVDTLESHGEEVGTKVDCAESQETNEQDKDLKKENEKEGTLVAQPPKAEPEIDPKRIDLNALWVVRRLRAKGHDAYLTGGCVRDLLLGKTPKDFDVATSAKPEEVKSIFRNCRLIGRRFLLAHVVFPGGKIIETATFRANPSEYEGEEENAEDLLVMQDNVFGNMKEDAFRRDLTINGLFYDPVAGKVIDYVDGKKDLKAGLIRTIGDPEIRLQEDPVRILRAIRFANRLGFKIEENTLRAMKTFSCDTIKCAPARLQEEIIRLLCSGHAKESFKLVLETGVLKALMPELLEGLGIKAVSSTGKENIKPQTAEENQQQEDLKETLDFWYEVLLALDRVVETGCNISSPVVFTALLLPAYLRMEASQHNERNWIDRLCVCWAERIRLARRDQDIIRILLSAIPLFSLEKIHQRSAQYLVRKPWFREGLLTFIIYLTARNESLEQIQAWKLLAKEADRSYRQERRNTKSYQPKFRKRRMLVRPRGRRFKKRPALDQ